MTRALAALLVALAAAACSGSDGGSKDAETPADKPPAKSQEDAQRDDSLRKLRAAQESAVEAMCERLADCAVEDAQKTMTPEERKEKLGNVEELLPRYRAECEEEANKSDLSPRQVKIIQSCVTEQKTCETFVPCLDQAQKKS